MTVEVCRVAEELEKSTLYEGCIKVFEKYLFRPPNRISTKLLQRMSPPRGQGRISIENFSS